MKRFVLKKVIFTALAAVFCLSAHAAWKYDSEVDKMSGGKTFTAVTVSENQLSFDFPYKGTNQGFLIVRQHPAQGTDVMVSITKGQMLCRARNCRVSVKFDDAKPVSFSGTGPADHGSTMIFFNDTKTFIAGAKKAKKILIQFDAFKNGSPVLEFATSEPLDWPRK